MTLLKRFPAGLPPVCALLDWIEQNTPLRSPTPHAYGSEALLP